MPKRKRASEGAKQTNVRVGNISDITTHHTITGGSAAQIKQLFDGLYAEIDRRSNTSIADKEDIKAEV